MGERINSSKDFKVVIDGGDRAETVTGCAVVITYHGYLDIQNQLGESVAIFTKFDSVIVEPAEQE
ncbi:hypothetical protein [Pseudomonas veronii]|uniref:hypothetical protein n=1 Tax=Pseudomonas veronii TaxID=76761 RepID=UPI000F8260D7|nr:hypothetical protein [Pseudomonas veronii]RTY63045.1 hypothetical protein EKA83_33645 [Pseudomonas veronii]